MKLTRNHFPQIAASLSFLAAYVFFQVFEPYHLMRREQMSFFSFDWNYICQTYRGSGWLARFSSDFLEQFFCLPAAGPLVVALLLAAIGIVSYRICRRFAGMLPSLAIAFLLYLWSFAREADNVYITRYTLVVLCYLLLISAALRFRKTWMKAVACICFLSLGVWCLGSPYHYYFGKAFGKPGFKFEKVIGLDVEASREHWDKVIKLAEKDLYMTEASYCYNLAQAKNDNLSKSLLDFPQNYAYGLLNWSTSSRSPFNSGVVGEAWYHLGDMALAEQSAMVTLIAAPNHIGTRPIMRLARINMILGEEGAAQKYLELLSGTLFYGKWARQVLAGTPDEDTRRWLEEARSKLAYSDFSYASNDFRPVLKGLVEANPENGMAREYLLCYDLLRLDLDHFIEDYSPDMTPVPLYQEAVLTWLGATGRLSEETAAEFGIGEDVAARMQRFFRSPERYTNTYWYYYQKMMNQQ